MKKLFLFVICTILFALCPAQAKETIVVWGLATGPNTKGLDQQVREFERLNPQYKVKLLSMGSGEMNPQKLLTSIVGGSPPDVIRQDRFSISDWASRGAFEPLNELIERDAQDPLTPKPEQYYPATWQEVLFEGKVYGIPQESDNRILYWNRTVFRKKAAELRAAGLDPESAPATWEEVLEYSKVLTEKKPDGSLKLAGWIPNFGNSWLYIFAFQMNAQFMSADGRTCTLNSPEAREALQFMVDGYDIIGGFDGAQSFQSSFQSGALDPFATGQVAMKVDGDWILNDLSRYTPDLDFAVAPAPVPKARLAKTGAFKGERDTYITWMGGFSLAIPRGAKNKEGAWQFIKFVSSQQGRMIYSKFQREWEQMRGREFVPKMGAHRDFNTEQFNLYKPSSPKFANAIQKHIEMAEFGRIRPPTFVAQLLWDEHVKALELACRKEKTPEEALAEGQRVVQRELDAYNSFHTRQVADFKWPFAFAGILVAFTIWLFVHSIKKAKLGPIARNEAKWGYILVSPWILGFLIFTIGPMVASFIYSFTQYNVLNEPRWVGAENYQLLIGDERKNVLNAFGNVLYLAGIGVPLGLATSLAIALLLNSLTKSAGTFRTIFYMPSIMPTIASSVLWGWILNSSPDKGLINSLWTTTIQEWFHISPPGWLSVADWSKPALITMGLWGAGGGMILWLAGLKGIPKSLYEAANIDGASGKTQFWSITVPMLSPIILFNSIMGLITTMQEFDRVFVFRGTSGSAGPSDSLLTPVLHLFVNGFAYFKMGYASALAWVVFLVILALTLLQLKLSKRWVYSEAER